jgi:hypothetical protein
MTASIKQIEPTDLRVFIETASIIDTHEHLQKEDQLTGSRPDILVDLFSNYVTSDLVVAGATKEAVNALVDADNPDIAARFLAVKEAWLNCLHTGYGRAVRHIALNEYGIEEINLDTIQAAASRSAELRKPHHRLKTFQKAGIDHVQTDDFCWQCLPDLSAPEMFLYDLSWVDFCSGKVNVEQIFDVTGIEARSLQNLREAMAAIFQRYGACAIAVKSQHAYNRTLHWQERSDAEAETVLLKVINDVEVSVEERNTLGDWGWARGVELAGEYNLPFKIHTGYYAGHSRMPVERISSGLLWPLLTKYPNTRFVLMHAAYPYGNELLAIAKHYPNVWVDLCWAWSINPYFTQDFVRSFLHSVPSNKLFGFGGDSFWPCASAAYAWQFRTGLASALETEVRDGALTERQAISFAGKIMKENQLSCFDVEGTRAAILTEMNAQEAGEK